MLVTTGFSKYSDREICLWQEDDLSQPTKTINLDSSSGIFSFVMYGSVGVLAAAHTLYSRFFDHRVTIKLDGI